MGLEFAPKEVVGGRIRARREELELDQHELAAEVGVTQPAVSAWEAGEALPRRDTWQVVAATLKTTVEALFLSHPRRASRHAGATG